MIVLPDGTEQERWSSNKDEDDKEHLEIAGIDENRVVFFFTEKNIQTCEQAWSADFVYYGVGLGPERYTGAAGLLLENDADLITEFKEKCSNTSNAHQPRLLQ